MNAAKQLIDREHFEWLQLLIKNPTNAETNNQSTVGELSCEKRDKMLSECFLYHLSTAIDSSLKKMNTDTNSGGAQER